MTRILGIDPGLSGAYAFLDGSRAAVGDLPVMDKSIDAAALFRLVSVLEPDVAIVELVGAMPGNSPNSMFNFGRSVGAIHGVLACAKIRTETVTPTKWKKHFSLTREKEKSRQLAIQKFPAVTGLERRKDEGRAEALLIALYYQETFRNAASS